METNLDRATTAIGELSGSVRALHTEVVRSEELRTDKIRWIQRLMYVLIPAVLLLMLMAVTNFVLLSRINETAADSQSTNELLLGCFKPGTTCSEGNKAQTAANLNHIRQTQFVIAVCQRQHPITTDADGADMIKCVQRYYPGFTLPDN